MSSMNEAYKIREKNVLDRAKLIVGLLMSWKSELALQREKGGEDEEMCSQEDPLTDACGGSCNCQSVCGHL